MANEENVVVLMNGAGGTDRLVSLAEIWKPPVFVFDGREFACDPNGAVIPYLYLAHKARRGDAVAAEVLTAFRVTIHDAQNKPYWPVPEQETE